MSTKEGPKDSEKTHLIEGIESVGPEDNSYDRETRPRMIEAQTEIPAAQVLSRNQAYINSLLSQAERLVSSLSPETMRDLIEKKATNHMKANQRFISADDHSKAKIIVLNMLRVLHATQLAVQAQQLAQVQYTLARPEPDKSFK